MRRLLFPILSILLLAAGCRSTQVPVQQKPIQKPSTDFIEVKMDMSLGKMEQAAKDSGLISSTRAVKDGVFNWYWIGDNFPHKSEWFFDSLCDHHEAFIKTLAPFDSLWKLGQLKFERVIAKGNFNCTATGGLETALVCNWDKVMRVAFANGRQPDFVHIFSYKNGFGTGNGGIAVTGVGDESLLTAPWQCPYYRPIEFILLGEDPGRVVKISGHEGGHGFGLDHYFEVGNLMWFATGGGCALGKNFLDFQKQIILNYIISKIR